jgi:hypothetical protein
MVPVIHTHGLASRRVEPKLNQWATYTREHLNGYKWDLNILVEQFNIWWRGWKNSTFRRFCGAVDGMWSLGPRSDLCGQRQTKFDSYIDSGHTLHRKNVLNCAETGAGCVYNV